MCLRSGVAMAVGEQLQLRFSSWPGNFHMPQVQPLKKKIQMTSVAEDVKKREYLYLVDRTEC